MVHSSLLQKHRNHRSYVNVEFIIMWLPLHLARLYIGTLLFQGYQIWPPCKNASQKKFIIPNTLKTKMFRFVKISLFRFVKISLFRFVKLNLCENGRHWSNSRNKDRAKLNTFTVSADLLTDKLYSKN